MYLDKAYIIVKRNVKALLRNKQKYKYTNNMQVMLMRLMSKGEYLIVPNGTKFKGLGKLGLSGSIAGVKNLDFFLKLDMQFSP